LLLVLVWRNRWSFVPEAFREELAEALRSFAALSRRLLVVRCSGHVVVIVALHGGLKLSASRRLLLGVMVG